MNDEKRPLFIFEMANNHQGDVEHGKRIIREIREVCDSFGQFDYAFKFQYRELDTFIHKDYQGRLDIKNIKRFQDTRLSWEAFAQLLEEARACRFQTVCTPFDEPSVERIIKQGFDFIKVASCSFQDWPLLEKVAEAGVPVIASAAGSSMEEIGRVVHFFRNRKIDFSLMHCVAEYPTQEARLELNQVDYYKKRFPGLRVGFSTHEPSDSLLPVQIAAAKGAQLFEKHVGVATQGIALNKYSASPAQVGRWLLAAAQAYRVCGESGRRYVSSQKEQDDLAALKRGVFLKEGVPDGHELGREDIYLAFPCRPGQLAADSLSKYNHIRMRRELLKKDAAVMLEDVEVRDTSADVRDAVKEIVSLLKEGNVVVPSGSLCEISHHYGIGDFRKTGVAMIDCINREYCKKILAVLASQSHPVHYHVKKEETFVILHGDLRMTLGGEEKLLHKGDVMTIERGVAHGFSSSGGCIFEEISTTHEQDDSYYDEGLAFACPRKTKIHFTEEMMRDINGPGWLDDGGGKDV